MTKPKQRGRPTKPARPGEKTTLSLRVTPGLKEQLEEAAAASGRNLSQEAELRLERSFLVGSLLDQAMSVAFSPELGALVLLLTRVAQRTEIVAGWARDIQGAWNWLDDPYAFDQISDAVTTTLEAFRPPGDRSAPPVSDAPGGARLQTLGESVAQAMLSCVATTKADDLKDWLQHSVPFNPASSDAWNTFISLQLGPKLLERAPKLLQQARKPLKERRQNKGGRARGT